VEAAKSFVSCCVTVKNINRQVFLLPREKVFIELINFLLYTFRKCHQWVASSNMQSSCTYTHIRVLVLVTVIFLLVVQNKIIKIIYLFKLNYINFNIYRINLKTGEVQGEVSLADVYEEFNSTISSQYKIKEFRSRSTNKKYAFGEEDIPLESEYLEVRYSVSDIS
jgi:hypothetical protein